MQNASSSVVVTAAAPRELNETVTALAQSKHHSKSAEIRHEKIDAEQERIAGVLSEADEKLRAAERFRVAGPR